MKVTVTHLKAPWPRGVRLGDVVEVGEEIPTPFVGKCHPAADDAEAAHAYVVQGGGGSGPPTPPSAELESALAEVAALRAMLAGGGGSGPPTLPNAAPEAPARRRG
jgi:hypothetical protein